MNEVLGLSTKRFKALLIESIEKRMEKIEEKIQQTVDSKLTEMYKLKNEHDELLLIKKVIKRCYYVFS